MLYHHFGCVVPSFEALELIRQVAKGRTVVDLGSGNGYWTYMLRRLDEKKPVSVVPVDSGLSEWRTVWIGDTVTSDGVEWLKENKGGEGMVLLLVYPQVGLEFTSKVLKAYSEFLTLFLGYVQWLNSNCRGRHNHSSGNTERKRLYRVSGRDDRRMDRAGDARVFQAAADTAAEFRCQGRGAVRV